LTKWPVFLQNAFGNPAYVNQTNLNGKLRKNLGGPNGGHGPPRHPLRIATALRPVLVRRPKKVFMCFSANLGRHFLKSSNVYRRHFYADFQGCCPDFQQIKTFGGALAPPAPPPPTPLLFITVS